MDTSNIEELLADLFIAISQGDKEVEKHRFILSKNIHFDPYSIFESLDSLKIGWVSFLDLYEFLCRCSISCTKNEVYNLISSFDKQSRGYFEYSDFLKLILPGAIPNLIEVLSSYRGVLSSEVISAFCNVIECELSLQRNIQDYKKSLLKIPEAMLSEVFTIVSEGKLQITKNDLTNFLRFIRPKSYFEVESIFRRVCRDKDGISFQDLIKMLETKEPTGEFRRKSAGVYEQNIGETKENLSNLLEEFNRKKSTPVKSQNELNNSRSGSEKRESCLRTESSAGKNSHKNCRVNFDLNGTGKAFHKKAVANEPEQKAYTQSMPSSLNSTHMPVSQFIRHTRRASESCLEALSKAQSTNKNDIDKETKEKVWEYEKNIANFKRNANSEKSLVTTRNSNTPQENNKFVYKNDQGIFKMQINANPNFANPLRQTARKGHGHTKSAAEIMDFVNKKPSLHMAMINPNLKAVPSLYECESPKVISKPYPLNQKKTSSIAFSESSKPFSKNKQMKKGEILEANELVKYFTHECLKVKEGEMLKSNLALQEDFNLIDAFRIFDKKGAEFISIRDLQDYLEKKKLYFKFDEILLLFRRYAKNKEMKLKFPDFSEMLIPKNESIFTILKDRIPRFTTGEYFSLQTIDKFVSLLEFLIKSELSTEKSRITIKRFKNFNFSIAFAIFDKKNRGYIEEQDLMQMLTDFNIKADAFDVRNIFQKFKTNSFGRITFQYFLEEFIPKSLQKSSSDAMKNV
ncbi:hypothetical protein SteCoe_20041 [Stentor coeruleus]|uniref:Calmodulin n=1 Tax=Stentor coeruleus TaxID=5963 RepID=A0A1R2BTD4_9CILI|nr:hypothetical protein SteCoe_20041 [Stentor coeruleus]